MFLGDQLLPYIVLAMGAAMAVGTTLALVRPPAEAKEDDLARPPLARSLGFIAIGVIAAIWAFASLVT